MKKSFAAVVLSLGLVGLAHASSAMPKGDATAGQAKAAVCAACHGPDGNSLMPTWPRLAGQNAKYLYKQLQDFKAMRRFDPSMAGMVAPLTEQDMADLATYFASQKGGTGFTKAELAKQGEKIFRGGNPASGLAPCSGCHNPAGKGNELAGFPRLAGQHADYVKKQLQAFRAAGRQDLVDPSLKRANDSAKAEEAGMMQMIAAKLTDKEIEAVASFIQGLH